MRRMACVDIPAFPLQLLFKEHPEWRELPAAVVAEEKPQAFILWANESARRFGIRPGHRYAAGLALARELRAGAISEALIAHEVDALIEKLRRFTPEVEPAVEKWHSPGLFWLNASGLEHLFASLSDWAREIRAELSEFQFFSSVSVGFTRFGSYAVARAHRGLSVFDCREDERASAHRVLLSRLDLPPDAQESFLKLGVGTVSDFLRLPARGLLKRFGSEVYDLHCLARGELYSPLAPRPPVEPLEERMELPGPETESERLLFFIKQLLDTMLESLDRKSLALNRLQLRLELDDRSVREEELRPDVPTLDGPKLLGLVRLRLERLRLPAGAVELVVGAQAVRRRSEQLSLVAGRPKRDPRKRGLALARLRAEFGEEAVVRAVLADGHLPRARFQWRPIRNLPASFSPPSAREPALIRRLYEAPMALPPRSRHEPDGWMLRGLEFGPVRSFLGPYILSGGWWKRTVQREYYFVRMQQGDVFWVFYDRFRRRWFFEGRIE